MEEEKEKKDEPLKVMAALMGKSVDKMVSDIAEAIDNTSIDTAKDTIATTKAVADWTYRPELVGNDGIAISDPNSGSILQQRGYKLDKLWQPASDRYSYEPKQTISQSTLGNIVKALEDEGTCILLNPVTRSMTKEGLFVHSKIMELDESPYKLYKEMNDSLTLRPVDDYYTMLYRIDDFLFPAVTIKILLGYIFVEFDSTQKRFKIEDIKNQEDLEAAVKPVLEYIESIFNFAKQHAADLKKLKQRLDILASKSEYK